MTTRTRLLIAAVSTTLVSLTLVSCGDDDQLIGAAASDNTLLAYVPEDAPYLAGNLEPLPEPVVESMFERAQPALDAVQAVLADTRVNLSGSAAQDNPEVAIMGALLDELDGKLSLQGLKSLGFDTTPNQAFYGLGVFPVVRVSLSDAQALRDTIGRIEANSGIAFPELQHQGQSYWKISGEQQSGNSEVPVGFYFAIIEASEGAHLALGILPFSGEAELLPVFLGLEKPANNTAAQRLADINRQYEYVPYGTGLLEFERLFEQFSNPNSLLQRVLAENGMNVSDHMSEVCQTEIRGLIARAPRMVAGTTEWTPSTMGFQYRLALADDLASELTELVADVPAAPTQSERLLEFAFGVRIGAARDFLIRKATALSQERYECESLQGINERATEALVTLNYPMPPLVNNLLGFRASLSQVPEEGMNPSEMVGTVALHVDKPEMFVGMSQMFLPQLAEFQLEKGGPPVRLPESLIPVPDIVAFAAMSDDAIGVSVGQGEETRLLNFLETEAEHDGSFFSVNYDIAAYMDRLAEFQHMSGAMDDGIMDGEFEGDRGARALRNTEMAEAFQEAFKNMAGRSELAFRFDEGGFAVDSRMQFQKVEE